MQTLAQTLQDHDRGHLKVIAHLWELELPSNQKVEGLSVAMLNRTPEILETLPGDARQALDRILENGGRVPMELLVRQFGPIRDMGPGKRDRLEPWKEPASPLEMLWYRGLMAKAFADSTGGPQEYGFVPEDLLDKLPKVSRPERRPLGEPAPPPKRIIQSSMVDDATTVLAAHRRAGELDRRWLSDFLRQPDSLALIEGLLKEADVFGSPEQIRDFLQMPRDQALQLLRETWQSSTEWNDLSQTPGVINPSGDWPNDPLAGRQAARVLFDTIPADTWWSVSSLVDAAHEAEPGFMRPPGGFDSWYLQSAEDGSSLRGFEAWHQVEGRYLRHLIAGPMLWLGLVDIGRDQSTFRLIEAVASSARMTPSKEGRAVAWPDGRIRVAHETDRTLRYQLARLCLWERMDGGAYYYRLTAQSLHAAEDRGLTAAHAHKVLAEIAAPEGVLNALDRWERAGMEARVERQMIVHVEDPQVLSMLLKEPSTRRYLGKQLGSNSVVVNSLHLRQLQEAALRLGLLIGINAKPDLPPS
ncbi:MAG: helicase-associated domain-containing protein [Anaerolineales bacterium]